MTKNKIVCPRCFGNGYIKIPNKAADINKQVIAQCTMCDSQGEIDEVDKPNDIDTDDRLQ
jgi:hypothetical protein|tara:strand:- start:321 stop:500 length:180 start_codon:yes stop_codon:yes gene_type:complete